MPEKNGRPLKRGVGAEGQRLLESEEAQGKEEERSRQRMQRDERWRKLYAILKANLLFMFESSDRLEIPVLLIVMEDCVVELADDNATGRQHSFSIKFNTTGHTYIMAATDYEALQNWVSVLTSCSFEFMEATRQSLESAEDEETEKRRAKDGESTSSRETGKDAGGEDKE
uniref:PH domain-containing protein n=1 Tax=Globodera pallida TaxID=36090 RepID=A0A183BYR4_GLOPA